jgi:hypothetical protein
LLICVAAHFASEDEGSIFLRNVGNTAYIHTVSTPKAGSTLTSSRSIHRRIYMRTTDRQAETNCCGKRQNSELMILTCVAAAGTVPCNDMPSPVPQSREPTFCKGSLTRARCRCRSAIKTQQNMKTHIVNTLQKMIHDRLTEFQVALSDLVVSVLAIGPKISGFIPGREWWTFNGDKNP